MLLVEGDRGLVNADEIFVERHSVEADRETEGGVDLGRKEQSVNVLS